jgi:hypothetical protein
MVGMTEIAGAISALKSAKDIAEAMISLRDTEAFQAKRIELQSKILEAQGSMLAAQDERSTLIQRIRDLEQDIIRLRAWDAEKQRYELRRWGEGAFAYVLKPEEARGEPIHALCAACYNRGVKSLIHSNREPQWTKHAWDCPTCKFALKAPANSLGEQATS